MENTINERVNSLMVRFKLNVNGFAKSLNKSYTSIDSIVKGKTKPGYDLLETIMLVYPQINPGWLLTGSGEMFSNDKKVEPTADTYLKDHLHTLEENFARLAKQLETKDHQLETKDDQIKSKDTQIDRLTRMLESVLGKPNDVAAGRSVIRIHPATQQIVESAGATA